MGFVIPVTVEEIEPAVMLPEPLKVPEIEVKYNFFGVEINNNSGMLNDFNYPKVRLSNKIYFGKG